MKRKILSLFLVTALVFCSFSFVFADQSYTVQPNDVLWKIAQKFDTNYQKLAEYNGIKNPHLIFPNQIIKIPDKSAVKPKEPVKDSLAADTVLKNGTVYTIDKANTVTQAVALKGNEIIFVGSNADAEAYVGSLTKVVDLKGKVVMPGMVDTHVHRSGSALTELFDIYLYECIDKEDTLKAIKEFIDANPDLDVYWGAGYSMGMAGDPRGPKAEWLDAICSDKPIILTSNDGHNTWLNTKALEIQSLLPVELYKKILLPVNFGAI